MTDEEFKRSLQSLANVLQASLNAMSRNLVWDVQALVEGRDVKLRYKATCEFDANLVAYYNTSVELDGNPVNTLKSITRYSQHAFEYITKDLSYKLFGNPFEGGL